MDEQEISGRLHRRIRQDYPDAETAKGVDGALRSLVAKLGPGGMSGVGSERLMAAVVVVADGDISRLRRAVRMAREDWRDLLITAGLADQDFADRLDHELGNR